MSKTHKKQRDVLYIALVAKGLTGKQLEAEYLNMKQNNITIDDLISDFIDKADKDPYCVSNKNCAKTACCGCSSKKL
ncbi:hypothetical protein FACS1894218_5660 [Bacilli bacterium]|nr:hypothetical protein FACS1894218_5660 [Bacilli bacterium]